MPYFGTSGTPVLDFCGRPPLGLKARVSSALLTFGDVNGMNGI